MTVKEWQDADRSELEEDKIEQGALAFDRHTEFLMEQKEARMNRMQKLCANGKIVFHPIRMQTFMNVVRKVGKKHNALDAIPTQQFPSIFGFLEALVKAYEERHIPDEDIKWIVDTFEQMDKDRVN